ncbi:MAG: restriction endonuclease subunit R [Ruminococcaceae bacterium]|nr:restriction endonuclease subunit R [Oscillospiraceae bacterium]
MMKLKEFQLNAVKSLFEAMATPARDIILKSPTGSGKTIILTYFMHQYIQSFPKTVFVWLTPGKGNLEEQSKAKMDKYIHASQTKLLSDVMTAGFEENDSCFINWEKLTKKGNNALKDSERTNFLEHIQHALNDGIRFVIIVDESHQNNTIKADEIIQYFHTDKIIRCSATPKGIAKAEIIEIPEEDVIAAGLIKKMLVINQDFPQTIETEDQTAFLLERALQKQRELRAAFLQRNTDINPLIVIQIPNKSETLQDGVERYLETQGLTYENGQLAVWLSDQHENLEGIDEPNAATSAVIIKQAVATGWDCPRAHILVKLRDNMDETFEIQTIGRIRRMPEAKHYESDLLDSCYLYTLDEKFTAGVKMALDKGALNACTLFLKNEYKDITLTSEQRTMVTSTRNPQKALQAIVAYAGQELGIGTDKTENRTRLQTAGYELSENIVKHTLSGETATLDFAAADMNAIAVTEKLNTHTHGRDYHQKVGRIGLEIGMEYSYMNTIIRKLFDKNFKYSRKILALEPRAVYAFVINNAERLRHLVREAMAYELAQLQLEIQQKSFYEFRIPQSCLFTYNGEAKTQLVMKKNVYQNYLSSAAPRSMPEVKFEKFCERSDSVDWWYKNGDKGNEYFSIVYTDNSNRQKLFYPDYIISVNGELWIIETKGGFDRNGNSQDIDLYTPKKFGVLKAYLEEHGINGGIVRNDATTDELCICMDYYSDDIGSEDWQVLESVLP